MPGIVIASAVEQLPAACTTIVEVREDGAGVVTYPSTRTTIDDAVLAGIDLRTAREAAVALSRFEDPELVVPGAALPSLVRLPPLLGIDEITPGGIEELWAHSRGTSTPIGIGENGPFELDLVRDGPHGLVGGTTGSGKSEFLRSLISGLAARNDPTKLTFILIDFKGGAAFKPLEALPHTIGTISNLDEQLADRALRALEAEMDYRQRMFAAAGEGVDNLDAYLATNPSEPMPRLLLVVDEFAMLAKDFPDVLTSLVSIGAVGRTLGVHMILATQRPAGVVNDDILANTNLRVALRVQSKEDSNNVIGVPHAAAISRSQKGRSWVKLGQEDITPVQTALVTGRAEAVDAVQIEYRDVVFGAPGGSVSFGGTKGAEVTEADMDLMIEAIIEASDHLGIASPRPVWPTPLGARVDLAGFTADDGLDAADAPGGQVEEAQQPVVGGTDGTRVALGLSDDPDHQRQVLAHWDMSRGNAMFLGIPGSGTSTTLMTVALALADELPPDEMDLIILDMGAGSTDASVLREGDEAVSIHLAGAGDMVTMLIASELGLEGTDLAERIKRHPLARVETLFNIRHEDGTVQFFDEPLAPELYARTVVLDAEGMLPLPLRQPLEAIRRIRIRAKERVFVTNALRALAAVSPTRNVRDIAHVVLVGGSALDFEIPQLVTRALGEYRVVAGRANIRGTEGPRNAVATGLVLSRKERP